MTASQQLKEKVDQLPEPLAREVLDFLLFVAGRHRKVSVPTQGESLRGILGHRADPAKRELETIAWEKVGLEKHASN